MDQFETELVRKIRWRILPLVCVLFTFSFLDRVNIGNAHEGLKEDLHLSEDDYSNAVGIFFLGYVGFELPANIFMKKLRPSRWISGIMVCYDGTFAFC